MNSLKELGRAIISIIFGFLIYTQWKLFRPEDPEHISLGVGVLISIVVFALLHLMGKES
jgi:hypothetical protein